MSRAIELLDSQQFDLLVELREWLASDLRLAAHGQRIELARPDALDVADGLVWAELRHQREGDPSEGQTHALALMPAAVL
ncbi:MAG: hypothetical protein KDK70_36175, partial [Myxococcales bacterium]|nr:hypothetical protein [Myxococcales bacterium]